MSDAMQTDSFSTTIKKALKIGENDAVLALFEGIDVKVAIDFRKTTLLHLAAAFGNACVTEYLVKSGCAIDAKDEDEITPLLLAVYFRHVEVARILVNAGADLCNVNSDGKSPIFYIKLGDDAEIRKVMRLAIDSKKACRNRAQRLCVKSNDTVNYCDLYSASPEAWYLVKDILSNKNRDTALHAAATIDPKHFSKVSSALPMLLYYDVDVNGKNNRGETALHVAAKYLNYKAIAWLLSRGADINARNSSGQIPLHVALVHAHGKWYRYSTRVQKSVELLLHNGSDVCAISSEGVQTILELSRDLKTYSVTKFIVRQLALLEGQGKQLNGRILWIIREDESIKNCFERCKAELAKDYKIVDDPTLLEVCIVSFGILLFYFLFVLYGHRLRRPHGGIIADYYL